MSLTTYKNAKRAPLVLLHEYEYMIRKTFGLFAAEMNLATIIETAEINQAKRKLSAQQFDMIILGVNNWTEETELIQQVRSEMTYCNKDIPIIVIVSDVTSDQIAELKLLEVSDILLKPTRIKTIQKAFTNSYEKFISYTQ